jgi:hypothetical protein
MQEGSVSQRFSLNRQGMGYRRHLLGPILRKERFVALSPPTPPVARERHESTPPRCAEPSSPGVRCRRGSWHLRRLRQVANRLGGVALADPARTAQIEAAAKTLAELPDVDEDAITTLIESDESIVPVLGLVAGPSQEGLKNELRHRFGTASHARVPCGSSGGRRSTRNAGNEKCASTC